MAYIFKHPGCRVPHSKFRVLCEIQGRPDETYHDDFATPGISPRNASPRKHSRHNPNFRRNARGRPQILQRLCRRVENFGRGCLASRAFLNVSWIFSSLTRFAVVDKSAPSFTSSNLKSSILLHALNGIPMCFNSDRA
jgi:hypothetical protein